MTPAVSLQHVSRHFGKVRAIDDISLDISQGEFFAMLGPSGSGKTTCLRLIAGFEQPTSGHIEIFGETAEGLPPYKRDVNTVFQDYALFPHMTVGENVAYGLMIKGMAKGAREPKAVQALEMVKLRGYEHRRPSQLSGGQRQRVALARALVNQPKVLLLDEPLGALDLKLREQMQEELKALQKQLGITFVFVTHDQNEALSMADRVAIFNEGRIVQTGSPSEVYEQPGSRFVADFVGSSNIIPPEFSVAHGGPQAWVSLRPEKITILSKSQSPPKGYATADGKIAAVHYQGATVRVGIAAGGIRLTAAIPSGPRFFAEGQNVRFAWKPRSFVAMTPD